MLARPLRVRLHSEFVRVTRSGRKVRCGSVVVYWLCPDAESDPGGARCVSRAGLIVGRSVGNAVTRHRVSRVIRAELARLLPQGNSELVVVRALPGAGSVASSQLRRDLANALDRLRGRMTDRTGAIHDPTLLGMGRGSGSGAGVSR